MEFNIPKYSPKAQPSMINYPDLSTYFQSGRQAFKNMNPWGSDNYASSSVFSSITRNNTSVSKISLQKPNVMYDVKGVDDNLICAIERIE